MKYYQTLILYADERVIIVIIINPSIMCYEILSCVVVP
jgi:hypothetical protein